MLGARVHPCERLAMNVIDFLHVTAPHTQHMFSRELVLINVIYLFGPKQRKAHTPEQTNHPVRVGSAGILRVRTGS